MTDQDQQYPVVPGTAGQPPYQIARLPRYRAHFVPWFVEWSDGVPDFRLADVRKYNDAVRFELCWMCGQRRGRYGTFVVGPMCAVNRTSPEPPSHEACAVYAAKACPFLANPKMRRRERGMPVVEERITPGVMIERNPGVALVWTSRAFSRFKAPNGPLFDIGEPISVQWFAHGRHATRAEVLDSIESGLPLLREAAGAGGRDDHQVLDEKLRAALALVEVPVE